MNLFRKRETKPEFEDVESSLQYRQWLQRNDKKICIHWNDLQNLQDLTALTDGDFLSLEDVIVLRRFLFKTVVLLGWTPQKLNLIMSEKLLNLFLTFFDLPSLKAALERGMKVQHRTENN